MIQLSDVAGLDLFIELLEQVGQAPVTVTGSSMCPFLAGGESVIVERVASQDIRLGDLLVFKQAPSSGGHLLLHRVVALRRRTGQSLWIQTQGDACRWPDTPVSSDQVLGRVVSIRGCTPQRSVELYQREQRLRAWGIVLRQRALRRLRSLVHVPVRVARRLRRALSMPHNGS